MTAETKKAVLYLVLLGIAVAVLGWRGTLLSLFFLAGIYSLFIA